jgi:type IV pilus assembly protein PilP
MARMQEMAMPRSIPVMVLALMLAAPAWAQPTPAADPVPDAMKRMQKAPAVDYAHLRDPFSSALVMSSSLARKEQRLHSDHAHEALEDFDLSTLKLVAVYAMGPDRVAMIQNAEGKGYVVRRGNYMGKHDGRIVKIGGNDIVLVEHVLNPAGEIAQRRVTLTLQTDAKNP